jgi:hypothetical protein
LQTEKKNKKKGRKRKRGRERAKKVQKTKLKKLLVLSIKLLLTLLALHGFCVLPRFRYHFTPFYAPGTLVVLPLGNPTAWLHGWVGLIFQRPGPGAKGFLLLQAPWRKGVCFYYISFLPSSGGVFYTKKSRRRHQMPGQF